jgi:hypothetical protein
VNPGLIAGRAPRPAGDAAGQLLDVDRHRLLACALDELARLPTTGVFTRSLMFRVAASASSSTRIRVANHPTVQLSVTSWGHAAPARDIKLRGIYQVALRD